MQLIVCYQAKPQAGDWPKAIAGKLRATLCVQVNKLNKDIDSTVMNNEWLAAPIVSAAKYDSGHLHVVKLGQMRENKEKRSSLRRLLPW
jgi:hypothetical protein